jgi:methylmalonyl-CoA mutase N-terminal domain/subunit
MRIEHGEDIVVGVNRFQVEEPPFGDVLKVDDALRIKQMERLERVKRTRDAGAVATALDAIRTAANGTENLMPRIVAAVEAYATIGEISDTLREVWGEYEGE